MRTNVYILALSIVFWLNSCAEKPSILAICDLESPGGYILKWEIYPEKDNLPIEIYVSDQDSVIPATPYKIVNSNDYVAIIKDSSNNNVRNFFHLKVGGTMSDVITNRFFELDSIQNFRDIGGYYTNNNRRLRWNKLFRSGSFESMTESDASIIDELKIKTVIDIRSHEAKAKYENTIKSACYIRIPIGEKGYNSIIEKITQGQIKRGDAIIYNQDKYSNIIENDAKDFALFFDYLCDENNYPIIFQSYLGKHQVDLATYFILKVLEVPSDIIEDDFMESNARINQFKLIKDVHNIEESGQEALTTIIKTDLSYLKYSISCMRKKSGSVDEYMTKEIGLTAEKRKKLQEILLY